jgi:hypothetical protein
LTGTADKDGNIKVNGHIYKDVHQNEKGNWVTDEEYSTTPNEDTRP